MQQFTSSCAATATVVVFAFASLAAGGSDGGADVAICDIAGAQSWGSVGDVHAFSIGPTTVNIGDESLLWQQPTNAHPVFAQNLYRYADGRLEMIGMSWVMHGFCALQMSGCGTCAGDFGCLQVLLPGCRTVDSASFSGQQNSLGPRSEVNASTGEFLFPFALGWNQTGDAIYKRLQAHGDDLDPELNADAQYFVEGQMVHPQEGTTDLRHNNVSYRRIVPTFSVVTNTYNLDLEFPVFDQTPAIYAWQAIDPEVVIEVIDVSGEPADGRFHVAYRVVDNEDGTWRYDYAVHNLNSHRSARGMTVHMGGNVAITEQHFHDVPHHSGEPYSNLPWAFAVGADSVSWTGESHDENVNANALRWGTMYNFGFVADSPPTMGEATLTLFRPGTVSAESVPVLVPEGRSAATPGDLNGDGSVNVSDLLLLLGAWGDCPNCSNCSADLNDDCTVSVSDLLLLLGNWG